MYIRKEIKKKKNKLQQRQNKFSFFCKHTKMGKLFFQHFIWKEKESTSIFFYSDIICQVKKSGNFISFPSHVLNELNIQ